MDEATAALAGVVIGGLISAGTTWWTLRVQRRHEERDRLVARCEEVVELCQRLLDWNAAQSERMRPGASDSYEHPPCLLRLHAIATGYIPAIESQVLRVAEATHELPLTLRSAVRPVLEQLGELPPHVHQLAKDAHTKHAAEVLSLMQLAVDRMRVARGLPIAAQPPDAGTP